MGEPFGLRPHLKEEKKQCCVRVHSAGDLYRGHICMKAAKVERDGRPYCAIHDPVAVKEKQAVKQAEWAVKSDQRMKKWRLEMAAEDLLAACNALVRACDQHPPMGLMNEIARVCEMARAAALKATSSSRERSERLSQ